MITGFDEWYEKEFPYMKDDKSFVEQAWEDGRKELLLALKKFSKEEIGIVVSALLYGAWVVWVVYATLGSMH